MKWLEFIIWVYRETGLRAFCLFLTGLWTISWVLGLEGAGPWMLCAAEAGERAWLAGRENGGHRYVPVWYNNSQSAVFI